MMRYARQSTFSGSSFRGVPSSVRADVPDNNGLGGPPESLLGSINIKTLSAPTNKGGRLTTTHE